MRSQEIKFGNAHVLSRHFDVFIILECLRQSFTQRERALLAHIYANPIQFRQRFLTRAKIGSHGGNLHILYFCWRRCSGGVPRPGEGTCHHSHRKNNKQSPQASTTLGNRSRLVLKSSFPLLVLTLAYYFEINPNNDAAALVALRRTLPNSPLMPNRIRPQTRLRAKSSKSE